MFEENHLIAAVLDIEQAIFQQIVHRAVIVAEERPARLREHRIIQIAHNLKKRLSHLAINIFAVSLKFRDTGTHDVRLFAMLEVHAARMNPFLALDNKARKLIRDLGEKKFKNRDSIQQVYFNVLGELGPCEGNLKQLQKLFFERRCFRRYRLSTVIPE